MKRKISLFSLFLITLLTSSALFAKVQVSATVSDNNVVIGDMFILTVIVNDKGSDYQLDTRPLEKDFSVFRPYRSEHSQFGTGGTHKETKWQMKLQANKEGLLTIPALRIGHLLTDPINIKVVKPSQKASSNTGLTPAIYIENSINSEQIYIGQSIIYTTKIYISIYTENLDLASPSFNGAEASTFGRGKEIQNNINGIRYNIVTQQYKMIATQAGEFEIDSPLLKGMQAKDNRLHPINIRGDRLKINVKPIPEDFEGQWIVSEDLRLLEDHDLNAQSYKVGEPITRSITLQIASIDKDKLPNIKLNYPKSLRMYPDQDQLEEGQANGLTYGVRVIRHAIIADEVGTLTLPEIKLNWFNSQTNQQETAILPAQQLTIIEADKIQVNNTPIEPPAIKTTEPTIIIDNSALIYWQITVAILLVIILFLTLYHLSYRRTINAGKKLKNEAITPLNQHYMMLKNAYNEHPAACYKALLNYAQHQYPSLKSLNQLAAQTALTEAQKIQLQGEIQQLEKSCSDQQQNWDSTLLAELIKVHETAGNIRKETDPMNLNP